MVLLLNFVFIVGFFGAVTFSAVCPPVEELRPYCTCNEDNLKFECSQPSGDTEPWDIKGTFDRVSEIVSEDTVFTSISITKTKLKEIPAGAMNTVKFITINIMQNAELEFIHPDAFNQTLETTTSLTVSFNPRLTNSGSNHTTDDIFNVVRQFRNLEYLDIHENSITSIPDNAFGSLPRLSYIEFSGIISNNRPKLSFIGSRAFAGVPKLIYLTLGYCDLSLDEIAEDAFEGIGKAYVDIQGNLFTRLPRSIFKPLLDNASTVTVGALDCIGEFCQFVEMDCDEVSDWICEDVPKYSQVLTGFACKRSSGFEDIFRYCLGSPKNKQG